MQHAIQQLKIAPEDLAETPLWDESGINQVALALQQRLIAQQTEKLSVRSAKLSDVEDIHRLLKFWTEKGETLPRSIDNIINDIDDFVVAEFDGKVVGCAAIYVYHSGLAELRSVAVDGQYQGKGQGRAMSEHLLEKAKELEIPKVIVLTRAPEFFAKLGFEHISIERLPEKVNKDCNLCDKQQSCDEVAMVYSETSAARLHRGQQVIAISA